MTQRSFDPVANRRRDEGSDEGSDDDDVSHEVAKKNGGLFCLRDARLMGARR